MGRSPAQSACNAEETLRNCIIYTRFSPRPNAEQCRSCESQEQRCRQYVENHGLRVQAVHHERNVSGGGLERPALHAALGKLAAGWWFVADSPDRLARDLAVSLQVRQHILSAGATLAYADGSPSDPTPEGLFLQNVQAAVSAYERDRIRARTQAAMHSKRQGCLRISGRIPIGWRISPADPKALVVDESETRGIVLACQAAAQGAPSRRIAERLDSAIGYCRGKPWSPRTIRHLIRVHAHWAADPSATPQDAPPHPVSTRAPG